MSTKSPVILNKIHEHTSDVSFEFKPEEDVILDGVASVYTDARGYLHITVKYERNARRKNKVQKYHANLINDVIEAMRVKNI